VRRFIIEAVVFSLLATALWYVTFATDVTRQATLELARILHRVAGYPAPYLLAEVKPYCWHSPLFPPLVGLMLASRWLTWRQRVAQLIFALVCFWFIVAVQIVIVNSPYLPLSWFRSFVERIYISFGYITAPLILWLILTGGPGPLLAPPGSFQGEHPLFPRRWHAVVTAIILCLLFTLPVFIAAGRGDPGWPQARRAMAEGLRRNDPAAALVGLQQILPVDPRNDGLIYLAARLHQRRGEDADARALARVVFQRRHMTGYLDKEFGTSAAKPDSPSNP
jgi:hypothetical protein